MQREEPNFIDKKGRRSLAIEKIVLLLQAKKKYKTQYIQVNEKDISTIQQEESE